MQSAVAATAAHRAVRHPVVRKVAGSLKRHFVADTVGSRFAQCFVADTVGSRFAQCFVVYEADSLAPVVAHRVDSLG